MTGSIQSDRFAAATPGADVAWRLLRRPGHHADAGAALPRHAVRFERALSGESERDADRAGFGHRSGVCP